MAIAVKNSKIPVAAAERPDNFRAVESSEGLGYNLPQSVGRRLWLPMLLMALMGWGVGVVLGIVEAGTNRGDLDTLQDLSHLVPAFMFIGFAGVFASITFAIARILGAFRRGGGEVQELVVPTVQTLKMPGTAKAMLAFMMMGMMVMLAGVVGHFIAAASFGGVGPGDVIDSAKWGAVSTGLRRMGVALYLAGIAFGLGTIIEVLRFQAIRIREVASIWRASHS